jgi:hypothetical protein
LKIAKRAAVSRLRVLFMGASNFRLSLRFHPIFVGRGYDLADQVTTTDLSAIAESIPICNTLPLKNRQVVGKAIALPYIGHHCLPNDKSQLTALFHIIPLPIDLEIFHRFHSGKKVALLRHIS